MGEQFCLLIPNCLHCPLEQRTTEGEDSEDPDQTQGGGYRDGAHAIVRAEVPLLTRIVVPAKFLRSHGHAFVSAISCARTGIATTRPCPYPHGHAFGVPAMFLLTPHTDMPLMNY